MVRKMAPRISGVRGSRSAKRCLKFQDLTITRMKSSIRNSKSPNFKDEEGEILTTFHPFMRTQ